MSLSRIGKKPVAIPAGVKVSVDGQRIRVEGPKGIQERNFVGVTFEQGQGAIVAHPASETREAKALHGLARSLLQNMVTGVASGFKRELEITGVGYRAETDGANLVITVGFSHPVRFALPKGITASVEKQTRITLQGVDKELLGLTAAKIRGFRPPEPYKGKGIKYAEEKLRHKVGKSGAK